MQPGNAHPVANSTQVGCIGHALNMPNTHQKHANQARYTGLNESFQCSHDHRRRSHEHYEHYRRL